MADPSDPQWRERLRVLAAHLTADLSTLVRLGAAKLPTGIIGLGRLATALLIAAAAERFLGWNGAMVTTALVAVGLGFGSSGTGHLFPREPSAADCSGAEDRVEADDDPAPPDPGSR